MRATNPDETCPACRSTNLRRRLYGLPSAAAMEAAERDPDLELGGCLISPTSWTVKCKDCGHEITLGETMSIFRGEPDDK